MQTEWLRAFVAARPSPDVAVGRVPPIWGRSDDGGKERGHAMAQEPLPDGPHRRRIGGDVVAERAIDLEVDKPGQGHMGREVEICCDPAAPSGAG